MYFFIKFFTERKETMKIKYFFLTLAIACTSAVFSSCDDNDEPEFPNPQPIEGATNAKTLTLGTESLSVKIGAENRQEVTVTDGNGNYSAFSSNNAIAEVAVSDGKILVEGKANGQADIIITDAANRFAKLPVKVYTTETMTLSTTTMAFKHLIGERRTMLGSVTLGNGEYSIATDNENVTAEIDAETGDFSVTAKAANDTYTATVTVTDCTGITAPVAVTVESTDDPFDDALIQTILGTSPVNYYLNYASTYYSKWGTIINAKQDDGSFTFGWDYYSYYYMKVNVPSQAKGTYENCTVNLAPSWSDADMRDVTNAKVMILKNDGTSVWLAFSYRNNDAIEYGYMVTSVVAE